MKSVVAVRRQYNVVGVLMLAWETSQQPQIRLLLESKKNCIRDHLYSLVVRTEFADIMQGRTSRGASENYDCLL